ncbi:hypothetical protein PUN28_017901 [Cardiocondyla obscurior]|uniref:Uncharacterized protein n=1 Tax=Cardiocondyla obscurior TaxID=286306 RepID=A0AAW2EN70_9HYME
MGHHERRCLLKTAGRWPWKSESAKECETTHLPKQLALKMDGAGSVEPILAVSGKWAAVGRAWVTPRPELTGRHEALTSRRVATVCAEGSGASLPGAAVGADLGGSSKYSSEAPGGLTWRRVSRNSRCTRVSRS